jgi:hypothetical protein
MKNSTLTHGELALAPTLFPAGVLAHGLPAKAETTHQSEAENEAVSHQISDGDVPARARLTFDEQDGIAPPEGFSTRETWSAAVWLNALAAEGGRVENQTITLPAADADAIRRWFYHRWEGVREGSEPRWVAGALAGIGSLARVRWNEVATHYRRCPWADVIQDAFAAAREAGLAVDRSRRTVERRRDAIAFLIDRPITTCRELSRAEWMRVGEAIRCGELVW